MPLLGGTMHCPERPELARARIHFQLRCALSPTDLNSYAPVRFTGAQAKNRSALNTGFWLLKNGLLQWWSRLLGYSVARYEYQFTLSQNCNALVFGDLSKTGLSSAVLVEYSLDLVWLA